MVTTIVVNNTETITSTAMSNCFMSGGCAGLGTYYRKMLYYPNEGGQSMESINEVDPTLLYSANKEFDYYYPKMEMTSNFVFLTTKALVGGEVRRYSLADYSLNNYSPGAVGAHNLFASAPYSDDVVYTIERDYGVDYDNFQLRKITFNGDGTTSEELIDEWIAIGDSYGGNTYDYYDLYWMGHVQYDTDDYIVAVFTYVLSTGTTPTFVLKIILYNIDTDLTSEQWKEATDGYDPDLSWLYQNSTTPSFYNGKIIFTLPVDPSLYLAGEPPYGNKCLLPTFIIDITDESITLVDDYLTDLDDPDYYTTTYEACSVIDYTTGIYYFTAWVEKDSDFILFSMDIASPSVVKGESCGFVECFQDSSRAYYVERTPAPGACDVKVIPSFETVTTVDIYVEHNNDYFESACAMDVNKAMIWNIISNKLQGKSLIGGADRDITVNWAGGNVPFAYPSLQEVWIRILDGMCLALVYSRSASPPYSYQQDYYILRP